MTPQGRLREMDSKQQTAEATHQRWSEQEEVLLLPGDGLILVSGSGAIQFFDNRARLLIGPASKDCLGQPLDTVWPALADLLEHHTVDVHAYGPLDTTVQWRNKEIPLRLFRSDAGMGAVLLGQRGEESQQACERLLMHQRILEQVRDAVIVTTAEPMASPGPVIVYANAAAQRQTGYRLRELVGRTPRIFQGPKTAPEALRVFHEAMASWQPVRQTVLNYRNNGTTFWVEIDLVPLKDQDGWHTYWVSVQRECKRPSH